MNRVEELQTKMDANPHCEDCAEFEYNFDALTPDELDEYEALLGFGYGGVDRSRR